MVIATSENFLPLNIFQTIVLKYVKLISLHDMHEVKIKKELCPVLVFEPVTVWLL